MKLDLLVKLNYQSIAIILSVGIKYSERHLLCDAHMTMPDAQNNAVRHIR